MMNSPTRKLLLGALVLALTAGAAFAVFAQEEESTETSACDGRHRGAGYHIPLDALTELDMTIGELRDHLMSGGTIEELLDESEIQAEWQANRLACIDELEANGDLTAEQAAALRAVIETGAQQAMREAIGGKAWGKGGPFGWSRRGGRGGPGIEMRRSFGGRGMPSMPMIPEIFRGLPFGDLDELFEELKASGSLDEALRERLEQLEEALRSGGRGFFGFRIDRDEDGKWHFDWYDEDDAETDDGMGDDSSETPSEESEESEDSDTSANNSA